MKRPHKLSMAELRRYLEEQSVELERRFGVGLKPAAIKRMLKSPDALRRAIAHTERVRRMLAADQAVQEEAMPHLIEDVKQIAAKRNAAAMDLVQHMALARSPTEAAPGNDRPIGSGRKLGYDPKIMDSAIETSGGKRAHAKDVGKAYTAKRGEVLNPRLVEEACRRYRRYGTSAKTIPR
jgi:hypothetical protein